MTIDVNDGMHWHVVPIEATNDVLANLLETVDEWLTENCIGKHRMEFEIHSWNPPNRKILFLFASSRDAVIFKLHYG